MLRALALALTLCCASAALRGTTTVPLVSFDGAASTTQTWREVNDPVMGGKSVGTFTVDAANKVGVFDGECKIVPSLQAPGFCNMQTSHAKFPDASGADALQLVVKSNVAYAGFKASFGPAPRSGWFASYKADFNVTVSDDWQTVTIPFNRFSSKWDDKTGEPKTTCAEDSSVCPDKKHLAALTSMEISAEGVAGKFHLVVQSISAVKTGADSADAAALFVQKLPTTSQCATLCPECKANPPATCKCDSCWPGKNLTDTPDKTCECFAELGFCKAGEAPVYTPGKKCPSCWPAENTACSCFASIGFCEPPYRLPTTSRCSSLCPKCDSPTCKCDACWPGANLTHTPDHTCECFAELGFCKAGEAPVYTEGKKCPSCWPAENKSCDCFAAIGFCEKAEDAAPVFAAM